MTADSGKDVFDIIRKYITGETNDNERKCIESIFSDGEDNHYLRNRLYEDWESMIKSGRQTDADLNKILDQIHHAIRKNESIKRRPLKRVMQLYMKVAAILLLPLLIAGGILLNKGSGKNQTDIKEKSRYTIYAPMGSRVSFSLSDGTTGVLNSGSRLSYSLPFSNERNIDLEGEAWFNVAKDEKHPFEISAGGSRIRVLGTSFNLSAYPAENYVEIVLQEGSVEFSSSKNQKIMMGPSERLVFQDGEVKKSIADPEKYNAWVQGRLVFREDPMAEVARRIERWYNIKVVLADKELEKYSFRGTFVDDTFEDVLKFLAMTSPITYKISPRTMMPDGTYTKGTVTIYKK